jgi:hypothetical protein
MDETVPLLTRDDLRRHSPFAWLCLAALGGVIGWLWTIEKHQAAIGTVAALAGCLGLILPPRERMRRLPARLRALPRGLDSAPVLATLLSSPGYGVNWFYGANPYDEAVHLLTGVLAGAVLGGLLRTDGIPRGTLRLLALGLGAGLLLAMGWEAFEWATGLIGNWRDTWTDVLLTAAGVALGAAWWGRLPAAAPRPA